MIAGVVLGCYALAWLFTARLLYARWRGTLESWSLDNRTAHEGETVARVMLAALAWPVIILTAAVRFRPPPTAAERAAEEKKLKARIGELERELNLPGGAS